MIIKLKNKETLEIDLFKFKCSVGKNGFTKKKIEGDKKTPRGIYKIGNIYFRKDRIKKFETKLKIVPITKNLGCGDDINDKKSYNKISKINKKFNHEKLYRKDHKYDLILPIKFNYKKRILGKGSCIFLHLTKDYNPTAGCIALKKEHFMIMLKLINQKTKIKIN